MMTIEYAAIPADVSALYAYCWKHATYFRRGMIFHAVLLGLFLVAIPFSIQGAIHRDDIAVALTITLAFPFVTPFIAKLRTKKDKRMFSIDSKGLRTEIGSKRGDIPWSMVANLFTTEEHVFILGRNLNGFCIPRNAFRNAAEREEFIQLCRAYHSEAKISLYLKARSLLTPSTIICAVLVLALCTYARPIGMLLYTKSQARKAPGMWIVPTPLPSEAAGRFSGRKFSYFGYEFDSPWTEVRRERKMESAAILNFSNGDFISVLDPAQTPDELQAAKQAVANQGADLEQMWGDAAQSRFALYSTVLNLTPTDLHWFSSRKEMIRNSLFLIMKNIWLGKMKGGLYSFETGRFHGFQEGSPAQDRMILIHAFDPQDKEIEMYIGSEEGSVNRPTQPDINQILYSIRPLSQP